MKSKLQKTLALGIVLGAGSLHSAQPFPWPNGARYAVSLTYDDAIPSHLKNAWPALDKAGLRGTFFLCCKAFESKESLQAWLPVSKAGHELGSHSLLHPCGKAKGLATPVGGLEAYDLDMIEKELKGARQQLLALGTRPVGETYAYPCGDAWVGPDKQSYRPLTAKYYHAAREAFGGVADPWTVDVMAVPAIDGAKSAEGLRYWTEQTEESGGWAVFMFHGVGGDYLSVKLEAHQALLDYLKSADGLVWVAPFAEVAAWVKKHQKK